MDVNLQDLQAKVFDLQPKCDYLLNTKEWCDVTFSFGEEPNTVNLEAHKLILSISSPVFATMFYGPLASKDKYIQIADIDHPIFKLMLLFIYRKSVELNTIDEAFKLYYAAKKYMFPDLIQTCTIYMMTNMQTDIALEIYEFAIFHDELMLSEAAIRHSAMNAKEVLKEDSFTQISPDTVLTLFKRDDLNIDTETDLIDAIARYNNLQQKRDFLKQVRYKCLTPQQFIECEAIHSVFTLEEQYAILANLSFSDCKIPPPEIYNTNSEPRKKVLESPSGFVSELIAHRSIVVQDCAYRSNFSTIVVMETSQNVNIIGIYIATQVFYDKFKTEQLDMRYDENIHVNVVNQNDSKVYDTNFCSPIHFDQITRINFDTPIDFKTHMNLKITIHFKKSGFYPTAISEDEYKLEGKFKFLKPSADCKELDGFIRAIIYN